MIAHLRAKGHLSELPFVSGVPVVGPLIVRIRRLWNWMSTKWYVQPLVQQQNAFNALVIESLRAIDLSLQAVEASVSERERQTTQQHVDLVRLEQRMRRIEERLAQIEQHLQPHPSEQPPLMR